MLSDPKLIRANMNQKRGTEHGSRYIHSFSCPSLLLSLN